MGEVFAEAGAMVRNRPVPLQHRTVRYGRSFLQREEDLGEQAQIFPAVDVGVREGLCELERAGEAAALLGDAESGRRGGVAVARVVLPRFADIVEAVDRDALERSGRAGNSLRTSTFAPMPWSPAISATS